MARFRSPFVLLVGALAALGGCNALLGLTDYEVDPCAGTACDEATGGGELDASPDTGPPPPPPLIDASGTAPVRWAKFKMPNYPQDGGPIDNPASYDLKEGAVVDGVSGLTWREPIPDGERGAKTWAEANEICQKASTPDQKWRLPSRIELVTLLDLEQLETKIDPTFFGTTEALHYWTLSEVRPYGENGLRQRWTVDFQSGALGQQSETEKAAVRCILDAR